VERGEGERTVGDKAPMTRGLGEGRRGTWLCTTAQRERGMCTIQIMVHIPAPDKREAGERGRAAHRYSIYEYRRPEGCTIGGRCTPGPRDPIFRVFRIKKGASRGPPGVSNPFWRHPRGPGPQTPIYGVGMGQSRGPVGYLPSSKGYLEF
jgi:hypothetical protein